MTTYLKRFELAVPVIECLLCGAVSANLNDIAHRYCGACHLFHDAVAEARRLARDPRATHECHEWPTARHVCAVCGQPVEVHAHQSRGLFDALHAARAVRREPLIIDRTAKETPET
jgi:hypothetical protein